MSFNCKLNKKYKDALKFTKPPISLQDICNYFKYSSIQQILNLHTEAWWRSQYSEKLLEDDEIAAEDEENYQTLQCCGISELITNCVIDKDTPETRAILAHKIQRLGSDSRVIITGIPVRESDRGSSIYNFKNYKVIRNILLDFGMKQVTSKLYKNNNSNNMLSVLVGQLP